MTDSLDTGLFSLYLGPKSSFTGSYFFSGPSLCVDFLSQFNNPITKCQFNKDEILWDERIDEIDVGYDDIDLKQLDTYSPNPELHWSTVSEYNAKQIIKLKHCNNFDSFQSGSNLLTADKRLCDEFEDKIRYQVEKSNHFRGFVNIYDSNTGFSGILSKLYPIMDDVFGRKSKLSFGIGDDAPNVFELDNVTENSVCSFLNYKNLKEKFAGLLNDETNYHLSAVLSLFMEQNLQIFSQGTDFEDLMAFLSPLSRNVVTSYIGAPFDDPDNRSLTTLFSPKYLQSNVVPLSFFSNKVNLPMQHTYVSCCGIPDILNNHQFFHHLSSVTSDSKVFSSATKFSYNPSSRILSSYFPQFFNDRILSNGRFRQFHHKVRSSPVSEIPVISLLQNSNDAVPLIEKVLSHRINVNENSELIAAEVTQDDISEITQHLNELLENYTLY